MGAYTVALNGNVKRPWETLKQVFVPNGRVTQREQKLVALFWIIAVLTLWSTIHIPFVPQPPAVGGSLVQLWQNYGLGQELVASYLLNAQALVWSTVISLLLSYLTLMPALRPVITAVTKGRFLGLVGLFVFFVFAFGSGRSTKLAILVFGITVFFVTSMVDEIARIPKEKYDHARTQGMGEWRVVWEVVVLGKIDAAFDLMRQNAAMSWTLLTMVEGISRAEGGVGAMLLNENKQFRLEGVVAIQLCIVLVAVLQDFAIQWTKSQVCPYSYLKLERR